ncbi:MAG: symmetrical bis(5'-nucleosyl)-tetraphosphatase [Thiobacillaceae bacterium]
MTTYVIGDVQGCYTPLRQLLDKVEFDPGPDRLWLVGDLVNRGPESLQVLRYVHDLEDVAVTVLGNHDLHLLGVWAGHRRTHESDTLYDILDAPDCDVLMHWLRFRPVAHYEHGVLMTHAGTWPGWTLEQTLGRARELEQALRGDDYPALFERLYGSVPDIWNDDLTGADRLRVITNVFTRMRFCTAEGAMEFHHKGRIGTPPPHLMPWFDVPGRKTAGIPIVFGHWSALGLLLRADILALDTGCLWGGQLTALRLEDRQPVQVTCPSVTR